ncbi:CapA family protein [Fredinandcohnia sp. 179-A 10B2 NHS]|uniref:CapA family protein n=1 Tax=Fredinandcohnia sp. 179-A 10B2 NHS TaxID=3235176 RepID=UPI0039A31C43
MRKRKKRRPLYLLTIFILLLLGSVTYLSIGLIQNGTSSETFVVQKHETKQTEQEFKPFTTSMTLAAVGDILIHGTVYNDAKTADSYDFKPMLAGVKEHLENADLTIANQETILGGTEIGLSTYPSFNSPFEVADALQDAGVDIVSIANNHTLDRGEKAILNATKYLTDIGMDYTGGYRSPEDREHIRVINRNGIKIAFLSYTYGTNGIPVPQGKEYLVNLIDMDLIKEDIKKAKELADVLAVSMHWGNEYQRIPNDEQKTLAQELADEGVNLIIGHHPHVLQPMEWLSGKDGNETFVIYSLGNFLSGQMKDYKDIGGVFQIEIVKDIKTKGETEIRLENPSFIPTYVTSQRYRNFRVVPLENAGSVGLSNASAVYEETNQHMSQWINGRE